VQVVPLQCDVQVTGTADRSFLQPGLFVKFSGEMDAKGVLQDELKELEIFTPKGKNVTGIFPPGSDATVKPLNRFEPGKYDFRGRVMSYKDGELVVVASKKITSKVAMGAEIKVNVQDLSFASVNDELKIRGWNYERNIPKQGRPGQAVAKVIEVTLAKPLRALPPKVPTKVGRLPKGKQQGEPVPASSSVGQEEESDGQGKKQEEKAVDKKSDGDKEKEEEAESEDEEKMERKVEK
jgi:hypothetical protein